MASLNLTLSIKRVWYGLFMISFCFMVFYYAVDLPLWLILLNSIVLWLALIFISLGTIGGIFYAVKEKANIKNYWPFFISFPIMLMLFLSMIIGITYKGP